jgi:hypothetical protein
MLGRDQAARHTAWQSLSEHIEAEGATVFRYACKLGCEGIVSKQRDSPYRLGRAKSPSCPSCVLQGRGMTDARPNWRSHGGASDPFPDIARTSSIS